MGFGSNDDNDNDLPDWLKGLQSEDDPGSFESGDDFLSDSAEVPDWLEEDATGGFAAPEPPEEEDVPDWLAKIREEKPEETPFSASSETDDDDDAWLRNIQEQYSHEEGDAPEADTEADAGDDLAGVQAPADEEAQITAAWDEADSEADGWGDEAEKKDPVVAAWEADTGTLVPLEDEEEVPDWVSGLPTVDPSKEPLQQEAALPAGEGEDVPPWLREIRDKTTEETRPPDDVLPAFGLDPADMYVETPAEPEESAAPDVPEIEAETPESPAFGETPPVTGSLPTWMEDLQTSGKLEPTEGDEDRLAEAPVYSDEDVSSLFEQDDLPDWLGPDEEFVEDLQVEEHEQALSEETDEPLEKADLPTWLQAMRPVEAVTADAPEDTAEVNVSEKKRETIGPLSGLSDVLPAEPHIVHFGSKPKPTTAFGLTDQQKKYAQLLKTLVAEEASYEPVDTRKVANPQQVLRWVIAILLLTVLFAVVWLNGDFIPLPAAGFPEENLAVSSMVNELKAGDKVLVAFEYQPGLSGEMEAASAALMEHLLLREVQLVLVSTQPVGPGLAESYLQGRFQNSAYIAGGEYANMGYVSGGTAGLLNFAVNPRQTVPNSAWTAAPLDSIQSVKDFSMVLVITDDPDIARSWVEQVHPLLDAGVEGQLIPLVMVTSAQAEPLVYPYYLTEPRQVSGLVSGVSGGAYYETVVGGTLARRYWDSYNVGLLLAVLVIAVGSIINLARNPLKGKPGGRS